VALGLLALLTPPLVAFAAYFGLWHALRHTARLSIEYPPAQQRVEQGEWLRGLWTVTLPGTPALVGTMLIAAVLAVIGFGSLDSYLWFVLALIWALTVPHMALTWRLDNHVLSQPLLTAGRGVSTTR
jgi:beta-carotene 15,15'-dioxygenase